jgi:hypothetical protein
MIIAIVLLTVSTVIAVAAVALWLDAPAAAMGDRAIDDWEAVAMSALGGAARSLVSDLPLGR